MENLKFYDVRTKKSFMSRSYKIVHKKGRRFAVAKHEGYECWRILGRKKK